MQFSYMIFYPSVRQSLPLSPFLLPLLSRVGLAFLLSGLLLLIRRERGSARERVGGSGAVTVFFAITSWLSNGVLAGFCVGFLLRIPTSRARRLVSRGQKARLLSGLTFTACVLSRLRLTVAFLFFCCLCLFLL